MLANDRRAAWAGVAVPIWTLGLILVATLLSPSFDWTVNALSNLGAETDVATSLTILVFNGALITGGLGGVVFTVALYRGHEHVLELLGTVVYGVSLLALAGVGVFPQDQALHFPMAAGHYLLFTVAFLLYGLGNVLVGDRVRGGVTIVVAVVHLAMWYWWATTVGVPGEGLAIPEIIGAVLFGAWTVWTARWHLESERAPVGPNS